MWLPYRHHSVSLHSVARPPLDSDKSQRFRGRNVHPEGLGAAIRDAAVIARLVVWVVGATLVVALGGELGVR